MPQPILTTQRLTLMPASIADFLGAIERFEHAQENGKASNGFTQIRATE
jgi:hypothetical protein